MYSECTRSRFVTTSGWSKKRSIKRKKPTGTEKRQRLHDECRCSQNWRCWSWSWPTSWKGRCHPASTSTCSCCHWKYWSRSPTSCKRRGCPASAAEACQPRRANRQPPVVNNAPPPVANDQLIAPVAQQVPPVVNNAPPETNGTQECSYDDHTADPSD